MRGMPIMHDAIGGKGRAPTVGALSKTGAEEHFSAHVLHNI